jgi:bacterial/archaeal transporter family-2 protein
MKIQYLIGTMFLGVVLAVHLGMNGKVMTAIGNARVGNALFWCIGAVTATIIGLTGWKSGALAPLKEIHPILLIAGCLGACLVFGIGVMFPKIGGANVMLCLLAGQVVAGMVLSHYGWLGSPVQPITLMKLAGVALVFAGVFLTAQEPQTVAVPQMTKDIPAVQADAAEKP